MENEFQALSNKVDDLKKELDELRLSMKKLIENKEGECLEAIAEEKKSPSIGFSTDVTFDKIKKWKSNKVEILTLLGPSSTPINIDGLASLKHLRELTLSSCTKIKNLDVLASLHNLEKVVVFNAKELRDISGLSKLKKLRALELIWCIKLIDLEPLRALDGLEYLRISMCENIRDFKVIGNLTSLRKLELNEHYLESVDFLSGLENLEEINFFPYPYK